MWPLVVALLAVLIAAPSALAALELRYECSPEPSDCSGWYREAVTLSWDWEQLDAVPSAGLCTPTSFTSDTRGTETFCEVQDAVTAQKTRHTLTIRIDRTPPSVFAVPDRPPDHEGWFNRPLSISFQGSDETSGVAGCSSMSYAGPEGRDLSAAGTCTDVAGNVGSAAFSFNYDATPPQAPVVRATPGDDLVALEWPAPQDAAVVEVARVAPQPGLVYRGAGTRVVDRGLRNGIRHRYRITAIDPAGNRASTQVSTIPTSSSLLLPPRGGRLDAPPLLVWRKAPRAAYYNVQLFRGSRKLLSRWPRTNQLQLHASWRFGGERRRLVAGRYTWYVWAVFGSRRGGADARLLGKRRFTITRVVAEPARPAVGTRRRAARAHRSATID